MAGIKIWENLKGNESEENKWELQVNLWLNLFGYSSCFSFSWLKLVKINLFGSLVGPQTELEYLNWWRKRMGLLVSLRVQNSWAYLLNFRESWLVWKIKNYWHLHCLCLMVLVCSFDAADLIWAFFSKSNYFAFLAQPDKPKTTTRHIDCVKKKSVLVLRVFGKEE